MDEIGSTDGEYVLAEDAINREAVLQAQIRTLEVQLKDARTNAARYEKLRRWMSSNVQEGWRKVENLAAIGCYVDWDSFDAHLDVMPVCNVGLCAIREPYKEPTC
jgi:hypothetical protein